MTTSDDRTFFSTGTVMADGTGGAVRAATSAGERMRLAAPQLTSDEARTAPRPMVRARFFRISAPPERAAAATSVVFPDARVPGRNGMTDRPLLPKSPSLRPQDYQ